MSDLAPILQSFFTDRMITQKHASPHTIRSPTAVAGSDDATTPCC
jgi:hypothetical protein